MNEQIDDLTQQMRKLEERVKKPRKDTWDVLQVLGAISLPIVVAFGGLFFNAQIAARERNTELAQLVLNITSQRELADTQIRAQMFNSLLTTFFSEADDTRDELRDKVTLLYLIQTNFVEYFNARALFEALHDEIDKQEDRTYASELKKKMRAAAAAIVDRQEILLSHENIRRLRIPLDGDPETVELGEHELSIAVEDVNEDFASVVLRADPADMGFSEIKFKVAYYDMPLTDYTTLPDDHRFAVTFKGEDTEELDGGGVLRFAKLHVIEFEDNRLLSRDRPTISTIVDMLRSLQENRLEESQRDHHREGG